MRTNQSNCLICKYKFIKYKISSRIFIYLSLIAFASCDSSKSKKEFSGESSSPTNKSPVEIAIGIDLETETRAPSEIAIKIDDRLIAHASLLQSNIEVFSKSEETQTKSYAMYLKVTLDNAPGSQLYVLNDKSSSGFRVPLSFLIENGVDFIYINLNTKDKDANWTCGFLNKSITVALWSSRKALDDKNSPIQKYLIDR